MTMECMDRQALAGFVHSFNQSISTISILLRTVKTEVKCRLKANQTRSERLIQLRSIQVQHLLHLSLSDECKCFSTSSYRRSLVVTSYC